MKDFILEENEEILAKFVNVSIKANNNDFKLNVILTNNRIIILKDINKEFLMNEFLSKKMVDIPRNLEVKLIIPIKEIKEIKYINGINKISFKNNNNKIGIKCADLKSFRIKLN